LTKIVSKPEKNGQLYMNDGTGERPMFAVSAPEAKIITTIKQNKPLPDAKAAAKNAGVKLVAPGWDTINFVTMLICIEHVLLILRIFVEQYIDDVPQSVIKGQK
jgi:hypothetical protein